MNDEDNWTVKDVFDGMSEEEKNFVYYMVGKALEDNVDDPPRRSDLRYVFDDMSEEDKIVVYYIIAKALEDNDTGNAGKEVVV